MGFWEFSNLLLPLDPRLRDDLERRKTRNLNSEINFETKDLLRKYFKKLVSCECMIEGIRSRIKKDKSGSINMREVFDIID